MKKLFFIIASFFALNSIQAQDLKQIKEPALITNFLLKNSTEEELKNSNPKEHPRLALKINNNQIDSKQYALLMSAIQASLNEGKVTALRLVYDKSGTAILAQVSRKDGPMLIATRIITTGSERFIVWKWWRTCCDGICGNSVSQCKAKTATWNSATNQMTCGCNGHCAPTQCVYVLKPAEIYIKNFDLIAWP